MSYFQVHYSVIMHSMEFRVVIIYNYEDRMREMIDDKHSTVQLRSSSFLIL